MALEDDLAKIVAEENVRDALLGRPLSPEARRFTAEYADFLMHVDFKDIADHPHEYVRAAEAHCSSNGMRHTIWLDKESPDFEGLMMHQAMRAILMERGFPRTVCPAASDALLLYLGSLLSSAITDPIIDGWLTERSYGVYNRDVLTSRTMEEVWLDARLGPPKEYEFLFCKWTLLTVLLKLDATFAGERVHLLHALIHKKFPQPWELGNELSRSISKKGFTLPHSALMAMLELRKAVKLGGKVQIVDSEGIRF